MSYQPECLVICLIIALLALWGCSTIAKSNRDQGGKHPSVEYVVRDLPIVWKFSEDFPGYLAPAVHEAFAFWNKRIGWDIFVFDSRRTSEKVHRGVLVSASDTFETGTGEQKKTVLGHAERWLTKDNAYLYGSVITFFRPWLSSEYPLLQRNAARHEVGHTLGLGHSTEPNCLMYPTINNPDGSFREVEKLPCQEEIRMLKKQYPDPAAR